jgi:hypothetical protein
VGHTKFLMQVMLHPQMMQLQRGLLGAEQIFFDHSQLLTRTDYPGGAWHSHGGVPTDNCGPCESIEEYDQQPNLLLCLCYPNGFKAEGEGGLKIIKGSHLFRDPSGCRSQSTTGMPGEDAAMEVGWLAGKVNPISGEPLAITKLELPPGSIVFCLQHAAHGVAPHTAGTESPRLCLLLACRKAHGNGKAEQPSAVPPVWAQLAAEGHLPPELTELLRPAFDASLTAER